MIGSLFHVFVKDAENTHRGQFVVLQSIRRAAKRARCSGESEGALAARAQLRLGSSSEVRQAYFSVPLATELPCVVYPGPEGVRTVSNEHMSIVYEFRGRSAYMNPMYTSLVIVPCPRRESSWMSASLSSFGGYCEACRTLSREKN